jgi:2-dehydropantoate 2-reductase
MGKQATRITVLGAGAVGCYFGGMLARAGLPVTLLRRAQPGATAGPATPGSLHIDSINFQESVNVAWAAVPAGLREADLVLFCVKTLDNETAAQQIAPYVKAGAVVVSLQNGVDNAERIRAASGIEVVPAVVYVAASMPAADRVKHVGRGDLVVGNSAAAQRVAQVFEGAGVKCRVSDNIPADLWIKLTMNCAGNAVTALGRASYGRAARHADARGVIAAAAAECVAVGRAAGVRLPDTDLVAAGLQLAQNLGDATSSTAQDIARGKRTEIDSLNGYVARRGAELGVPTPVNSTLCALVKLLEEAGGK